MQQKELRGWLHGRGREGARARIHRPETKTTKTGQKQVAEGNTNVPTPPLLATVAAASHSEHATYCRSTDDATTTPLACWGCCR